MCCSMNIFMVIMGEVLELLIKPVGPASSQNYCTEEELIQFDAPVSGYTKYQERSHSFFFKKFTHFLNKNRHKKRRNKAV